MYQRPSRRKQIIQRVAVYSFMTTTVLVLVTLFVLATLGYRLNREDGTIAQVGLVQLNSRPTGATIEINGQRLGSRTGAKTNLNAGEYHIAMQRDGYRTWQKSVQVEPGSILWLNYARLIPERLTPEVVAEFSEVSSMAVSPDRRYIAVKEDPSTRTVSVFDVNSQTPSETTLALPTSLYTTGSGISGHEFTVQSWSDDGRYLLIEHDYREDRSPTSEYLVVDTRNLDQSKNITELFNITTEELEFHPTDSRYLYAKIGNDLRRIDLNDETLSRVLVANVHSYVFSSGGEYLTYTTRTNEASGERSYGYYQRNAEAPVVLGSIEARDSDELHVALGRYYGDIHVAVALGQTLQVYTGSLSRVTESEPMADVFRTVTQRELAEPVTRLSLRTEGRFVTAEHDGAYSVYDIELSRLTTTELRGGAETVRPLDSYMFWSSGNDMLHIYEFDGANQHDIMPSDSQFDAVLTQNGRFLYSISPSSDDEQPTLQRVQLQ